MPKPRTGSVRWSGDHYEVRITISKGKKSPWVPLPKGTTEDKAIEAASGLSEQAKAGNVVLEKAGGRNETVASWFGRWFDHRARSGVAATRKERGRVFKWARTLLKMRMTDVTTKTLEQFVAHLDESAQRYAAAEARGERPKLANAQSWKSAINVWSLVSTGFSEAFNGKAQHLRVGLPKNPAENVRPPDRGTKKARTLMSPARFLVFVNDESIDLAWRRIVTLAIYTYARASELRGVRWSDVNTRDGIIVIHRTISDEGEEGTTKSDTGRVIPIEPALVPLLEAMRVAPDALAFELPDDKHMARGLRRVLERASLDDGDLKKTRTRAALTWHDLRGTGITWRAIRGDDPLHIMASAGHEKFETTQKYIRAGALLRAGYRNPFPALPESLLVRTEQKTQSGGGGAGGAAKRLRKRVGEVGFEPSARGGSTGKSAVSGASRVDEPGRKPAIPGSSGHILSEQEADARGLEDELCAIVHDAWAVAEGRTRIAVARRPAAVERRLRKGAALLEKLGRVAS